MQIVLVMITLLCLMTGCAPSTSMVKPLAPENQITSLFKFNFITTKNVDVIIVSSDSNKTIVEDVASRERFELDGRYGKVGERFVVRY